MKPMISLFAIFSFSAMTGCLFPAQRPWTKAIYPPASASQYEPYFRSGSASLRGEAFLKTRGGEVKTAAGEKVWLDPITDVSVAWWEGSLRPFDWNNPTSYAPPDDPIFLKARRSTMADAQGRFAFEGLPAGNYLVRTWVSWDVPSCNRYGCSTDMQGGAVGGAVILAEGEAKSVIFAAEAEHIPASLIPPRAATAASSPSNSGETAMPTEPRACWAGAVQKSGKDCE